MVSRFIRTAWNTYKKNAGPLIGAQLVYVLAVLAIVILSIIPLVAAGAETILNGDAASPDIMKLSGPFAFFFIGLIIAIAAAIAIDTGRISIYFDALNGREVLVRNMLNVAKEKLWTSLGSAVIVTAIVAVVGLATLLLAAALSAMNVLLTPVIVITAVLAVVLFSLLFSLTKQAIAIRNRHAFASVEESYRIVKRNYSEFLLIAIIIALAGIFLTFARGIGTIVILFVLKPVADLAYTQFYVEKAKKPENTIKAETTSGYPAPKKAASIAPVQKQKKKKAPKKGTKPGNKKKRRKR